MHVLYSIVEIKKDFCAELPSGCTYRVYISKYEPSSYVYAKLVLYSRAQEPCHNCGRTLVPSYRRLEKKEKEKRKKATRRKE
jgi:formamidopyrimidine-DNA glycosylase